jgi:hypothetical protein
MQFDLDFRREKTRIYNESSMITAFFRVLKMEYDSILRFLVHISLICILPILGKKLKPFS